MAPKKRAYTPKPGGLKCAICGDRFWALGVHVKHKHGISARDYKIEYGLPMGKPLVHKEISEAVRSSIMARLECDAYKKEVTERCRSNALSNSTRGVNSHTAYSAKAVALRNHEKNEAYLLEMAPKVQAALNEESFIKAVAARLKMSACTIKKMAARGIVEIPSWYRTLENKGGK